MRVLRSTEPEGREFLREVTTRAMADMAGVEPVVREVVGDVLRGRDTALRNYAGRWDGLLPDQPLRVDVSEMQAALEAISPELRGAITTASANIRSFCEWQMPKPFARESRAGVSLGQVVRPLDSVGCYVPGGRYPLPSTLMMTVIPAQVAGVPRIVVCSPNPPKETLATAALLGVTELYRVGGAQAVAAMAYGTETVSRVTKIVGPGNSYVTAAKKWVNDAGACAIDMLAGPTEALILSRKGNARFIAADLVAQAEHDPETCCLFVTTDEQLAQNVSEEVLKQSEGNDIARAAIGRKGAVLLTASWDEAIAVANEIASEHLTIDDEADLDCIRSAGSVFIGDYSAQPLGDYVSGPNHVLPTAGTAKFRGGLSVSDFVKIISVQKIDKNGFNALATSGELLAKTEGLTGHRLALQIRREGAAHA